MGEPVLLEVRERRSPVGRVVRWVFFGFQAVMIVLLLGTCAVVTPFLSSPDPEVAVGAGMFGAIATALLWLAWPVGTLLLGLLMLLTRGRKRLIPAPPPP
jgi:bacteriorhodopsin